MPITHLMQKLSGKLSTTTDNTSRRASAPNNNNTNSSPQSMELCLSSSTPATSFEVMAEVVPLAAGAQPAGTSLCSSSRVGSDTTATTSPHSSAARLASLTVPELSADHSKPATARALRARGKAMLRTESGLSPACINTTNSIELLDLQHQLSLESSSSLMMLDTVSPRYGRASTAPLPSSSYSSQPAPAAGSLAFSVAAAQAGSGPATAPLSKASLPSAFGRAAAVQQQQQQQDPAVDDADDDADDDDVLVDPMAAAEEEAVGGADDHCHWEDGVIASWLQGIDHTELLHSGGDDDEQEEQQPSAGAHGKQASQAATAGGVGQQHVSRSMPTQVFSSLLYN